MNTDKKVLTAIRAAKYLGCKVKYPRIDKGFHVATLTGVSLTDGLETRYKRKKDGCIGDYLSFKNNGNHNTDALHCQLILTPLEKITDEDATEVCRLTNANVTDLALKFDKKFVQMGYKVSKQKDSSLWNYDIIDFLRFKGYDCDNAISEGWAISSADVNEEK